VAELQRHQEDLEMQEKELEIIKRQKRLDKKKKDIYTGPGADDEDDSKEHV